MYINHSDKDSFVIYMCVKGSVEFIYGAEKSSVKINYGETLLIPSVLKEFTIISEATSELLEVYIK
jgi:mannose-6-phosphate isomerase